MLVNGTLLRARLRALSLQLDAQTKLFNDALRQYPGENKQPLDIMDKILRLEETIALVQVAQQWYNLNVTLDLILGTPKLASPKIPTPLALAVKLVGAYGRIAKLWRNALPAHDRYGDFNRLNTRAAGDETQSYTLEPEVMLDAVTQWSNVAANIQSTTAVNNTQLVDIPWLTEELLGN